MSWQNFDPSRSGRSEKFALVARSLFLLPRFRSFLRILILRILILFPFAASGCNPQLARPASGLPRPLPDSADVFLRISEHANARASMRALGRVTYFGSEGRVRLRSVLLAERKDRFRVEVLSPAEEPLGVMACNGQNLWLLKDRRLRSGPATPENIAQLLPIPMIPQEIVDVLLGGLPSSDRFRPQKMTWDRDEKNWLLTLGAPDGEEARLTVDPERLVVLKAEFLRGGTSRMEVTFDDFEMDSSQSGLFPRVIVVQAVGEQEVRIRLEELETNVSLEGSLFQLSPPAGVLPEPMAVAPSPQPAQ